MNRRQFFGLLAGISSALAIPAKEAKAEGKTVVYGREPLAVTVFFRKNGSKWYYAGYTETKKS